MKPRICILTLAVPNARRSTVVRFRVSPRARSLRRRCADAIEAFAARHGIAPVAVDYSTEWETA